MGKFIDLTTKTFGRLTVIERSQNKKGQTMWVCECSCNKNRKEYSAGNLKSQHSQSCGCLKKENSKKIGERVCTHKMSYTSEYTAWIEMIQRCRNPNHKAYHHYGGRGITVCDEWLKSFELFYKDVGPKPNDKYSIDRINNDGNYEKTNVKWSTAKEQANNRRHCKKRRNSYSNYYGVSWNKKVERWVAYIWTTRHIHIGIFDSEIESAKAHDKYVIENKINKPINFQDNIN